MGRTVVDTLVGLGARRAWVAQRLLSKLPTCWIDALERM
jgi:hypothetical protein